MAVTISCVLAVMLSSFILVDMLKDPEKRKDPVPAWGFALCNAWVVFWMTFTFVVG